MKDEIKEILDRLKDSVDNPIDTEVDQFTEEAYDIPNYFCLDPTTNDCKVLLDYITNLQEKVKLLTTGLEATDKAYKDYKSRNEKAIEFVKKESKKCYTNQPSANPTKVIGNFMWHTDELLNILQGSDKDE